MYNEKIEALINAALADGVLTEKEKQILFKRAEAEGVDLDEFEMILDARLVELQKEQKSSAPKSDKFGDVRKCPACGAIVNSFSGVCGECGFIFENIQANLSSTKLAELLRGVSSEEEEERIINSFPIPVAKSDLLEFITRLHSYVFKIEDNSIKPYSGYFKKYSECIEKCKLSFDKDKELSYYVTEYTIKLEEYRRSEKKESVSLVCSMVSMYVGIGISLWLAYILHLKWWGWFGFGFAGCLVGMLVGTLIGKVVAHIALKYYK